MWVITKLGGGHGYTWLDQDLALLEDALQHWCIHRDWQGDRESEAATHARDLLMQLAWLRREVDAPAS